MNISTEHLDKLVNVLNVITDSPFTYKPDNFHISSQYSGYSLQRMQLDGGTLDVLCTGSISKLGLYRLIEAYIKGIMLMKVNYENEQIQN